MLLGEFVYQPKYLDQLAPNGGAGKGDLTMTPASGSIDLGVYEKLYLSMLARTHGCPSGKVRESATSGWFGNPLVCITPSPSNPGYIPPNDVVPWTEQTYRTDDPATASYLYVGGVQLPNGSVPAITSVLPCDGTSSHAWEDGGNFAQQDFYFDVKTTCAPDASKPIRLTK